MWLLEMGYQISFYNIIFVYVDFACVFCPFVRNNRNLFNYTYTLDWSVSSAAHSWVTPVLLPQYDE